MNTLVWTFCVGVPGFRRIFFGGVRVVSAAGKSKYAPFFFPATDVQLHTVIGAESREEREDVLLPEILVVAVENRREVEPVEGTQVEPS